MIFRYNGIEVKTMKDKCQKYEGLFIFGDEKDFTAPEDTQENFLKERKTIM